MDIVPSKLKNYKEILPHIKAIVLDVDGVLTDGSITLLADGSQGRTMNIKDGYALQLAVKMGIHVAIISGGKGESLRQRLEYLGIHHIYLGSANKTESLNDFLISTNLLANNVLYMGDDLPDYQVMKKVALPCCPADAAHEIREISLYVSSLPGGKGCVRDVIEQVLKVQKKWATPEGFSW
ncbi:MAG: HAD-IIIA family hydrolase [Bacteroidia bacterium]|nr:HAD-IIIA family hydrolase [Bacteroidia bacterium]